MTCFFLHILHLFEQLLILHSFFIIFFFKAINVTVSCCHYSSPFFTLWWFWIKLWSKPRHYWLLLSCCPFCSFSILDFLSSMMIWCKDFRLHIDRSVEISSLRLSVFMLVFRNFKTVTKNFVYHTWLLELLFSHFFTYY